MTKIADYYGPVPFHPEDICERIQEMLDSMGWSWPDLAKRAGADEDTLRRIRSGEVTPAVSMIHGLAEALGITYPELTVGLARHSQREPPSSRRAA